MVVDRVEERNASETPKFRQPTDEGRFRGRWAIALGERRCVRERYAPFVLPPA